jgi:hypothetical protein
MSVTISWVRSHSNNCNTEIYNSYMEHCTRSLLTLSAGILPVDWMCCRPANNSGNGYRKLYQNLNVDVRLMPPCAHPCLSMGMQAFQQYTLSKPIILCLTLNIVTQDCILPNTYVLLCHRKHIFSCTHIEIIYLSLFLNITMTPCCSSSLLGQLE